LPDLQIQLEKYKGDDVKELQNALRKICTGENIMNNIENMLNKFQMVLNKK
jgi:urease gamma subunit